MPCMQSLLIDQPFVLPQFCNIYSIFLTSQLALSLFPQLNPLFSSMGSAPAPMFCRTNRHLITFLLFLLIAIGCNRVKIIGEGRATPQVQVESLEVNQKKVEEKVVMVRSLIGSRPPRCERRCRSCGHCEAVQVPIAPRLNKHQQTRSHQFLATPTVAYSRGDDISNYKPMCWKCKCGNFIFNP